MRNPKTKLVYSKYGLCDPQIAIVIPVYNQASIISRNLRSVLDHLEHAAEILLIDDASTDESMQAIEELISSLDITKETKLASIKVFKNKTSQYETYCDAFLFANCESKYVIEIQADMQILQKGFDSKLLRAIMSFPQLIGVSARGIEPLSGIIKGYSMTLGTDRAHSRSIASYIISRLKYQIFTILRQDGKKNSSTSKPQSSVLYTQAMDSEFLATGYAGRIASKINIPVDKDYAEKNVIFIGETIMRGPIIVDREKYIKVGGFDTSRFFQGYDEHEFFVKAFSLYGYRVGYTPLNFSSPLSEGSSRKRRSLVGEFQVLRQLLKITNKRKSSTLWKLAKNEIYPEYQHEIKTF
jgi:glycosyltransferase involved in cell wall biosynthesis